MTSNSSRHRSTNDLEKSNSEAYREEWQRKLSPLVPDRAGKTIMALRWYHWRETNRVVLNDRKRFPGEVGLDLLQAASGRSRSACQRDLARFEEIGFVRPIKGGPYGDEYVLTIPPAGIQNAIPTGISDPTQAGLAIPTTGTHKPSLPSNPKEIKMSEDVTEPSSVTYRRYLNTPAHLRGDMPIINRRVIKPSITSLSSSVAMPKGATDGVDADVPSDT